MRGSGTVGITLGGTAIVCCPHDREKRVVKTPDDVIRLAPAARMQYDPKKHIIQFCPCCENCFAALDDIPTLCGMCLGIPIHKLEAALPKPTGEFDG